MLRIVLKFNKNLTLFKIKHFQYFRKKYVNNGYDPYENKCI